MSFAKIIDFIEENIAIDFKDMMRRGTRTLRRIDIALDIRKDINELILHFKDRKQKGANFFGDKGQLETCYI